MIEYHGVQIPSTPREWKLAGSERAEKKASRTLTAAARRAVDMKMQGATSEQAYAMLDAVAIELDAGAYDTEPREQMWKVAEQGRKDPQAVPDLVIDFGASVTPAELLAMTDEAHRLAYTAGSSTQVGLAWHSIGRALEGGATSHGLRRKKQRAQHQRARKSRVRRRLAPNPARAILRRAMRGT